MQDYGLFLATFLACTCVCSCLGVYLKRNHPFVRCRSPYFLIWQCLGSLVACTLLSLHIALRPRVNCGLQFYGVLFSFSGFAVPCFVRYWDYCASYHTSKLKAKVRVAFFLDTWTTKEPSFFLRHPWIVENSFLVKALIGSTILFSLPAVIALFPREHFPVLAKCEFREELFYAAVALAAGFLLSIVCVGKIIYSAKDVFKVKHEMGILLVFWSIIVPSCAIYATFAPHDLLEDLPPALFLLFGLSFSLLLSIILPLAYGMQYDKSVDKNKPSELFFEDLLQSPHFRNVFYEFLMSQYCQENLQFYEIVTEWKELPKSENKTRQASHIYQTFILASSICQVNVEARIRDDIARGLAMEDVPDTLFDDALAELVSDMHMSSFRMFKASGMYQEACTELGQL